MYSQMQPQTQPRRHPHSTGLDKDAANFVALSPLSCIERWAAVYPDRTALVYGARRQSWLDRYQRCRRLASALTQREVGVGVGVGVGDTVAVMLPHVPAMLEAHFGVPMCGAVLNTRHTRLDADAIAFMLQHGGAKVLLTDREFAGVVKKALSLLREQRLLVVEVDDDRAPAGVAHGDLRCETLLAEGAPQYAWQLLADG